MGRAVRRDALGRRPLVLDIEAELLATLHNPGASSCAEESLMRVLKKYDSKANGEEVFHLEELSTNSKFALYQSRSGMIFQKGEKMRTRFRCLELTTKRQYFVSGLAEVTRIENH